MIQMASRGNTIYVVANYFRFKESRGTPTATSFLYYRHIVGFCLHAGLGSVFHLIMSAPPPAGPKIHRGVVKHVSHGQEWVSMLQAKMITIIIIVVTCFLMNEFRNNQIQWTSDKK